MYRRMYMHAAIASELINARAFPSLSAYIRAVLAIFLYIATLFLFSLVSAVNVGEDWYVYGRRTVCSLVCSFDSMSSLRLRYSFSSIGHVLKGQ